VFFVSREIFIDMTSKRWSRSVVGIATRYRLKVPGIELRWGRDFSAPVQNGPGAQPAFCTMGIGSIRDGKAAGA
jgi:hypothetical protein